MTIALSWIRTVGRMHHLVCATDSRLRFGGYWDCGPKLYPTPRGDLAIMFAGSTLYAYPIITHLLTAISSHEKSISRRMDLFELRGHLMRILNASASQVSDLPKGADTTPDVEFIFAGYDWKKKDYANWLIHYDRSIKRFTFRRSTRWGGGNRAKTLTIAGDYQEEFKKRLISLLRDRSKLNSGGFNMEPFEVLRDMIRSNSYEQIGGAPQLLKIHPYLNYQPISVYWPNASAGTLSLGGRILLDYEKPCFLKMDPDTLEIEGP